MYHEQLVRIRQSIDELLYRLEETQKQATHRALPQITAMAFDNILTVGEVCQLVDMTRKLEVLQQNAFRRALELGIKPAELARIFVVKEDYITEQAKASRQRECERLNEFYQKRT